MTAIGMLHGDDAVQGQDLKRLRRLAAVVLVTLSMLSSHLLMSANPALASSQATVTGYSLQGTDAPSGIAVIQSGDFAGKVWVSAYGSSSSSVHFGPNFTTEISVTQDSDPEAVASNSTGTAFVPSGSGSLRDLFRIPTNGSPDPAIATQADSRDIVMGATDDVVYLLGIDGVVERLDITDPPSSSTSSAIGGAWALAYSPDGRVAVSRYQNAEVVILDSDLSVQSTYSVAVDPRGLVFDSSGNLYTANNSSGSVSRIAPNGEVTSNYVLLPGKSPIDIAVDNDDALYVADRTGGVSRITPEGAVMADWGPQDQVGTILKAIDVGPNGAVWVTNTGAERVQRFTPPPAAVPNAPSNVAVTPGDSSLTLTWDPAYDNGDPITEYQYSFNGTTGWTKLADPGAGQATISGLNNGQTYTIYIRGINGIGDGAASTAVTVTPVSSQDPPGVPGDFEVLPGGSTLSLSWEAPSPGGAPVSGYEYKTDSDAWLSLNTTGTSAVISTDSAGVNLDPATEYVIQVRARNANGPGDASASVSRIPGVPLAPQSPSSEWDADSLTLTWSAAVANGDPITEYRLVVSQISGRSRTLIARSGPGTYTTSNTSYTIPGLDPTANYTITLTAKNGRGYGISTTVSVQGPESGTAPSQTPAPIIQQVGLPTIGTCDSITETHFGTQTSLLGGWGISWAQWMNDGVGGPVCTRTLVYSNAQGRWVLVE